MAIWKYTLDLSDVWEKANDGDMTHNELAGVIATRLGSLNIKDEDIAFERDDLVDEFKSISEDTTFDVEDFDGVMSELYDWGDMRVGGNGFFDAEKLCWIKTNF